MFTAFLFHILMLVHFLYKTIFIKKMFFYKYKTIPIKELLNRKSIVEKISLYKVKRYTLKSADEPDHVSLT